MTNFQYGGWLVRAAALVATLALWESPAQAKDLVYPSSQGLQRVRPTCAIVNQAPKDSYVLLLFFDKRVSAAVQTLFEIPEPALGNLHPFGCVPDPDYPDSTLGLIVQGSCPTDCTRRDSLGSTIFFADPYGKAETADDDLQTTFRVWQIVAKDACHAGRILNSLVNGPSELFKQGGGYIGHIMIGAFGLSTSKACVTESGS